MNGRSGVLRLRLAVLALCLLLPSASLIPLGAYWLWQNGFAVYWVIGACVFVVLAFAIQALIVWRSKPPPREALALPQGEATASWTAREKQAWEVVDAVAKSAGFADLTEWDSALALGRRTVEAVAAALHPEVASPLWQFTVPEALTLVETVSARLKPIVADSIPLGDRLTVAQVLRVYGWRSVIDTVQKGYDVWRLIRMLNPATAATQELRERLSKQMMTWTKEEIGMRLVRGYVYEVGRAAIDLYGGRLRVSPEDIARHISEGSVKDLEAAAVNPGPVRLLIGGQINAGKSSLINAIAGEVKAAADVLPVDGGFAVHELKRDGLPQIILVESPGASGNDGDRDALIGQASKSDLIIWVASAARADRETDRRSLDVLRKHFADRPNLRPPPIMLVVSQIDKLRPFKEWHPPYDLNDASNEKARSINAALDAVTTDLGFPASDAIPASLDPAPGIYNADAIVAAIAARVPDAKRAQLVRAVHAAGKAFDWKKLTSQAVNTGRLLRRAATSDRNIPPTS